jgi:3D-(3,5/4)-trihydroxycyclohexane-1,2-dione acylhydrolase (decyclizing)
MALVADARAGLEALGAALGDQRWTPPDPALRSRWLADADAVLAPPEAEANALPSDAQVIGAVQRSVGEEAIVVCAAGGLPGELHKLWRASRPNGYHLEYGFSTMGYEIAGGLGVKMARPEREVVVMVGDGSYMMMNSELSTAVMLGRKLIVVLLDNRGFGCINRLQLATGGASFNNLLDTATHAEPAAIDFAAHAAAMGAHAEKVDGIAGLEAALARARASDRTTVLVIDTDPMPTTEAGGHWWDVAVPEVSTRPEVTEARRRYETAREHQRAD